MEYFENIQLKNYNSFRTEAMAKSFCQPPCVNGLREAILAHPNEEKLVIGSGCNLFFTKDFDGLVINLRMMGVKRLPITDDNFVFLEVAPSEDWDDFVAYCVDRGYAGLENLSYIPSSVGASPVQNIGAYGAEVKDCIHEVITVDKETAALKTFTKEECEFGYRDSIFKRTNKYIIVSVVFKLGKSYEYIPRYTELNNELASKEHPSIKDVREAVIKIRQRKLPNEKELPNAGSFFKNPTISKGQSDKLKLEYPDMPAYPVEGGLIKTSAAYLIDRAGYKGKRSGDIGTYPNQPLIIVNYGSTNGNDIIHFMHEIQAVVSDKFGIALEPEVRIY